MTPARQKWWDSLTKAEREVREAIKANKTMLWRYKAGLDGKTTGTIIKRVILKNMKLHKTAIKALRKQIGMNVGKVDGLKECPCCGEIVKDWHNYCSECGQKLRWGHDFCNVRQLRAFF